MGAYAFGFIRFTSETEVMKANKAGSYPRFINQDARSGDSRKYTFSLVPISDMYWDRALIGRSGPDMLVSGNRSQLFILGGICLLILLAGVMNFINLYLVLMVKRGKVYSLRKVFGADRKALFKQIFIETFIDRCFHDSSLAHCRGDKYSCIIHVWQSADVYCI